MKFDSIPNPDNASQNFDFVYYAYDGNYFTHWLTNDAWNLQEPDEYWNTKLKEGEEWDGTEAKINEEAEYPDGKYKVYIRAYDIKENYGEKSEEVIIDNFKPYVKEVVISGRGIPYTGRWKIKSESELALKKEGGILRPGKIEAKVIFSETMDTTIIPQVYYDPQGEGKGAGPQPLDFVCWETTNYKNDTFVGKGMIPNNKEGFEGKATFVVKDAKDLAGNDLDGEPGTIATYTANSEGARQWSNHLPLTDIKHSFTISFEKILALSVRGYSLSEENPSGIVLDYVNSEWKQEFSSSVFSPGEVANGTQYLWINILDVSITSTTVVRIKLTESKYGGALGGVVFDLINFGINIVGYDKNGEIYWSYHPNEPYGIFAYYGWNTVKGGTPFEQHTAVAYFPVFELVKMPVYGNKDPMMISSWDVAIYGVVEGLGTVYSKWEISGIDFGDIKEQNNPIDHLKDNIMTLSDAKSTIKVKIPANTFSKPVNIELKKPSYYPSNKNTSLKATNVGVEIIAGEQLSFGKEIEITIEYKPESGFNLYKNDLVIARYDESRNDWKILPSQSFPDENRIVARTDHLSVFQTFELRATKEDFAELIVYPNPCRTYEHGNSGIIFKNLTSDINIKIYNIAGELVFEDNKSDNANKYFWPLKNINGEKVASGLYLYFISNPKGQKAKGKLAVIK